jgi:hypothetical protein
MSIKTFKLIAQKRQVYARFPYNTYDVLYLTPRACSSKIRVEMFYSSIRFLWHFANDQK